MPKRILLIEGQGQYGLIEYFIRQMEKGFRRHGAETRRIGVEDSVDAKKEAYAARPDLTFAINSNGHILNNQHHYDRIQAPHLAYVIDDVVHHATGFNLQSPFLYVATVDAHGVEYMKSLGFSRTLFLPHGTDGDIAPPAGDDWARREYDVVVTGSLLEYRQRRLEWPKKFDANMARLIEAVSEMLLYNKTLPIDRALRMMLEYYKADTPNRAELYRLVLQEADLYVRGWHRVETIRAIRDARVDIFGNGDWAAEVGGMPNVRIHAGVSMEEGIEVMKRAKVLLNTVPTFKFGAHERIFNAMAAGAVVVANDNEFLRQQFAPGGEIVLFDLLDSRELNETVNGILQDPAKGARMAAAGRAKTLANHTWAHRAKQILDLMK